jgi:hypothetical protein
MQEPIISVEEFRRLTGLASESYSDEQIEELILQLDFIARLYIKSKKQGEKAS